MRVASLDLVDAAHPAVTRTPRHLYQPATMASVDMDGLKLSYLGCAPITQVGEEVVHSAMELLMVKLDKLQQKMVDKVVEKKHGTRLSHASPVYQKLCAKLRKQGLDCTQGDPIKMAINPPTLDLTEDKNGAITSIALKQLLQITVLPSRDEGQVIFAFIQDDPATGIKCHGLLCEPVVAEKARMSLMASLATLKAESKRSSVGVAKSNNLGDKDSTITFGVGLHRKSSLRVSGQVRRQGTINLKGKKSGSIKRPSQTYGKTFTSLAAGAGAGAWGAMGPARPAFDAPGGAGRSSAVPSDVGEEEDDDLLDDFDEDMFGTDDVDGDAVGVDNPNLVDGDDDELGDDIDLGSLGFDQ